VSFHDETLKKLHTEETLLNILKAIYERPIANITVDGRKMKSFQKSVITQGYPLFPILFNIVLEFLARVIRQEKDKDICVGKEEVKLFLFETDSILYLKDPENSIKKLLDLIVAGHENQYKKSVAFLYTNNSMRKISGKQYHAQ
jgi:hypothetical protein